MAKMQLCIATENTKNENFKHSSTIFLDNGPSLMKFQPYPTTDGNCL